MTPDAIGRSNLKSLVREYRRATGRSLAAVSKEFYGNGNFFQQLFRKKQGITLSKFGEIMDAFRARWPDGAEWPHLDSIIFDPPRRRGR